MEIVRVNNENIYYAKQSAELFYWDTSSKETREINEQFFESSSNILYVAVKDGKVVGSVYGYELERYDIRKKQLFIYSVDVLEEYRKQGIGKKLIKEFIGDLKSGGYHNAFVITNKENYAAVSLYKSTGANQVVADDGDHVLFRWV